MVYYIVSGLLLMFFWCPCMAINVNVIQYNGGFLPTLHWEPNVICIGNLFKCHEEVLYLRPFDPT